MLGGGGEPRVPYRLVGGEHRRTGERGRPLGVRPGCHGRRLQRVGQSVVGPPGGAGALDERGKLGRPGGRVPGSRTGGSLPRREARHGTGGAVTGRTGDGAGRRTGPER